MIIIDFKLNLEKCGDFFEDDFDDFTLISEDPKIYVDRGGKSYIQDYIIIKRAIDDHSMPLEKVIKTLWKYFNISDDLWVRSDTRNYSVVVHGKLSSISEKYYAPSVTFAPDCEIYSSYLDEYDRATLDPEIIKASYKKNISNTFYTVCSINHISNICIPLV